MSSINIRTSFGPFYRLESPTSAIQTVAYHQHNYVLVEQRMQFKLPGMHYYLCISCGDEKPLLDSCVIDMDHQHEYCNYRGCNNGFYILRCRHFGCESFLRLFNTASLECSNNGKHFLEEEED